MLPGIHGSIPVMSLRQIIQPQIPFWAQEWVFTQGLYGPGPTSQVQAWRQQLGWPHPQTLGSPGPGFWDPGIEDRICHVTEETTPCSGLPIFVTIRRDFQKLTCAAQLLGVLMATIFTWNNTTQARTRFLG